MENHRSLNILAALVFAGIAISGWLFGWKWKGRANRLEQTVEELRGQLEGNAFTEDEKALIDLQDQVDALRQENSRLSEALRKKTAGE